MSIAGLDAELERMEARGAPGTAPLRSELEWRRPFGNRQMSVLEAKALRLLRAGGIRPMGVEVRAGRDLRYRLDILVRPGLAVEVDGYAYHSTPEQLSEDARRRNHLLSEGTKVLVYTWRDVTADGHRVLAEVRHAMAGMGVERT